MRSHYANTLCAPPMPAAAHSRSRRSAGLTLTELAVTVAIMGTVIGIAMPQYQMALENSRTTKARQELKLISIAIDAFKITRGRLPLTLHEIGYGNRFDPWGNAYCYLNYASGTGDGLAWALDTGLVDPTALPDSYSDSTWSAPAGETSSSSTGSTGSSISSGSGSSGSSGNSGNGNSGSNSGSGNSGSNSGSGNSGNGNGNSGNSNAGGNGNGVANGLSATESLVAEETREELASNPGNRYAYGHIKADGSAAATAATAPATEDLTALGLTETEAEEVTETLGGQPLFLDIDVPTVRRRNQYMFPLNTDYDLFSLGPNGRTAAALNNPTALDDVIRANNGGYFGNASEY